MVWNYAGRTTWSQTEDDQVRALLAEGKPACAIAKAIDRSELSVYRRIEILTGKPKAKKRHCMCCGASSPRMAPITACAAPAAIATSVPTHPERKS